MKYYNSYTELEDSGKFGIQYEVNSYADTSYKANGAELDWYLGFGGAQNAIVSDICCEKKENDIYYTAKIKYYLLDTYTWEDEPMLHNLHLFGMCREYADHACYENTIIWKKGARYPVYKNTWDVDLLELSFKDIEDKNIKSAHDAFRDKYPLDTSEF